MIKLRPYVPSSRIAVRDSIDEEISDDIDDDVFIKDARSAKLLEEKGLKRPLMAPRRRSGKLHSDTPIMQKHRRCNRYCEPLCYFMAALTVLCAMISLAALILTLFPLPLQRVNLWWRPGLKTTYNRLSYGSSLSREFVPCTQISVQKLWTHTFARMNSESPLRAADLNGDGIKDVIFGYGVDDNIHYEGIPLPRCKSPQQGEDVPCEGGVIAVNGRNGELLWQTWSVANVFSLLCALDIDQDGYTDCIAAGRLGMIFAINGRNGNNIWQFRELTVETNYPVVMDLYTINIVRDLNGDEVPDIIAAHLEEREDSKAGHIKLISGKSGKIIRTIPTPNREEVFVPLQVETRSDGTEMLLIITGGQNTPGGVYSLRLLSLMEYTSEKEFTPLYQRNSSGLMVPAVLTDITGDGVADVVVAAFNATVLAFDGRNYSILWNFSFPASESVSAIVPGHFNHDNVTDFMVKYNTGPGFPVYYYSQTTVLDGRTGQPLLDGMMTDSGGSNSLLGGVSISQTFGGDFFLHWQLQCRDRPNDKDAYEFIPDSDIILQARADTCRLRYNQSTVIKLYAIARHIEPPGAVLFSTDDLEVHLNYTERPKAVKQSPLKHPKWQKNNIDTEKIKNTLEEHAKLYRNMVYPGNENLKMPEQHKMEEEWRKQAIVNEVLQELNNEVPSGNYMNAYSNPSIDGGTFGGGKFKDIVTYPGLGRRYSTPSHQASALAEPQPVDYDIETTYENEAAGGISLKMDEQPIHLRSKYPTENRDIRRDVTGRKQSPMSLWDLELEKEQQEAEHAAIKIGEQQRIHRNTVPATKTSASNGFTATLDTNSDFSADWFLASISSTGVLLKSLNNTLSTLDFVFVLNIRESETYPPLFQPQDLNCVEEKISAYKSYTAENQRVLRKQFLKQCLKERLVDMTQTAPKYESQLIIARIGISCTCRALEIGEVCSELDNIETQRWTGFMGNEGNGYFAN